MFPDYKNRLLSLIWMGVGSALLTTIFSSVIIGYIVNMNKQIKQLRT
ncbi:hypothetical protein [Evansella cellulosilytica]|nr:hypothetical protein [Evansella cellulosilytica]